MSSTSRITRKGIGHPKRMPGPGTSGAGLAAKERLRLNKGILGGCWRASPIVATPGGSENLCATVQVAGVQQTFDDGVSLSNVEFADSMRKQHSADARAEFFGNHGGPQEKRSDRRRTRQIGLRGCCRECGGLKRVSVVTRVVTHSKMPYTVGQSSQFKSQLLCQLS
jgi:hypothetical protein